MSTAGKCPCCNTAYEWEGPPAFHAALCPQCHMHLVRDAPPLQVMLLHADAKAPRHATAGSAGMDLFAYPADEQVEILPGQRVCIPTGIAVAVPIGFELQIRPRSGLAAHFGVTVINPPGTIDADYRGEVVVILINHGAAAYTVARGDRIAQAVLAPVTTCAIDIVPSLSPAASRTGGLGSTGR